MIVNLWMSWMSILDKKKRKHPEKTQEKQQFKEYYYNKYYGQSKRYN